MRVLIVGNGGREHALLWKLRQELPTAHFYATRPNGGMAGMAEGVEIPPAEVEALAGWASARHVDLTVVGPEAPLAAGIVDRFRKKGLPIFGPTARAARIESSKAYAKELMRAAGVPTAAFRTFTEVEGARAYIREVGAPVVVKASGLAAGKGAIVCGTVEEAEEAAVGMLTELRFGEAGREIVVEEYMQGEELSVFGLTDGREVLLLLASQDHKPVGEGDTGPNTGGMGAYAPVSVATPDLVAEVRERIFLPALRALEEDDAPFQGLLYAGLMLTTGGPKVVEFNCRFGDPESQAVLPLLESSLLEPLACIAEGAGLGSAALRWREGAAVTTVLASRGYPGSYEKGKPIRIPPGLEERDDILLFHAGTARRNGGLVTSGGRVLAVTGLGTTFEEAAEASRGGAEEVAFEGKYFRRDIGWRELARRREGGA